MTTITRNRADGTLLIAGVPGAPQKRVPAVLRGGTYDLFYTPHGSAKALVTAGTTSPVLAPYAAGKRPCQSATSRRPTVAFLPWDEQQEQQVNHFGEFFAAMTRSRCNFLRVFLSLSTRRNNAGLLNMVPFKWELRKGRRVMYDVKGAVEGRWDEAYFERLTAFIRQADEAGVVVQLSLFNYYDIVPDAPGIDNTSDFSQFAGSPWNADNCTDQEFGLQHLIKTGRGQPSTHEQFLKPKLRPAQNAFVRRVIVAVGTHKNVVLEIMSEPRPVNTDDQIDNIVAFDSAITGMIIAHRTELNARLLISVNASHWTVRGNPVGPSDAERWSRTAGDDLARFNEVDIVSYHGLTAWDTQSVEGCNNVDFASEGLDRVTIGKRADRHDGRLRRKALLFSTDAVLSAPFIHYYPTERPNVTFNMRLRDGQINCSPAAGDGTVAGELTKTNVRHWATKCLKLNTERLNGKYHFQNHSSFDASLVKIAQAAADVGL